MTHSVLEQSCKKVYSRTTTKSISLLQPGHRYCQQNGSESSQVKDWYRRKKWWWFCLFEWQMLLRGCCIVLNKIKAISLCLLWLFKRDVVDAVFLEYSKEGKLSSSHVGIRNISSDVCYDDTKHYQMQSEHRRIQKPFKHLRMECFCGNS